MNLVLVFCVIDVTLPKDLGFFRIARPRVQAGSEPVSGDFIKADPRCGGFAVNLLVEILGL